MIRKLVTAVARWHDTRRPARRENEMGIIWMRRCLHRSNRRTRRRINRFTGRFPWWGLGSVWRWLYRPYFDLLEQEHRLRMSKLSMSEFIRETIRDEGIKRMIMPIQELSDSELNLKVPVVVDQFSKKLSDGWPS